MKKPLFACDIDNTLIYSRKHPHSGWPCVEWIHGAEQAYMSPRTIALLAEVAERTALVPVTSRSVEQALRLKLPGGLPMAVTANGADLLVDGAPDPDWRRVTDARVAPWRGEITRLRDALGDSPRYIRCRVVDDAYLFVYCAGDVDPAAEAERLAEGTPLRVMASGKKIYLLPPPLDKGEAFDRLAARLGCPGTLAAGDSAMDLPMLLKADAAIAPAGLGPLLPEGAHICPEGALFSEYALETAAALAGDWQDGH